MLPGAKLLLSVVYPPFVKETLSSPQLHTRSDPFHFRFLKKTDKAKQCIKIAFDSLLFSFLAISHRILLIVLFGPSAAAGQTWIIDELAGHCVARFVIHASFSLNTPPFFCVASRPC